MHVSFETINCPASSVMPSPIHNLIFTKSLAVLHGSHVLQVNHREVKSKRT